MVAATVTSRVAGAVGVAAGVGALAIGAFTNAATRAHLADAGPSCPFRWVTGLPCPFCGMTHATIALGAGRIRDAFHYHPLAPVVLGLFLWASILLLRDRPSRMSAKQLLVGVLAIWAVRLVVFWGWKA